jgi:hypothetical protein
MNLQDILNLASGPQGWLLIGSGILLLLVLLVYRRIGKLAVATRNDLAEMRQTIAQLADRLDTVPEALTSISAAVGGEKAFSSLAETNLAEEPEASVEDTYGYAAAAAIEDDTDLTGAEATFTPDAVSELSGELPGAAEEPETSVEDTYGYAVAPNIEDDTDLTEAEATFTPDAVSELSGELPGAAEEPETSVEDTYGYAVAPNIEDDTDLTEAEATFTPDAVSELSDELPGVAEEPETSVEDTYDYAVTPSMQGDGDLAEFGEAPAPEDVDELPEGLQDTSGAPECFGEFQFGTAASLADAEEESLLETEQREGDDQEASFQSSEASESFTFGSGAPIFQEEEADLAQSESLEEPLSAIQTSNDDTLETSRQVPSENVFDSTTPSQTASQPSSLESLPGDSDRPQVGVVRCAECGRKIAYPKRLSGKRMRCPACRATSVLP